MGFFLHYYTSVLRDPRAHAGAIPETNEAVYLRHTRARTVWVMRAREYYSRARQNTFFLV